MRRAEAEALAGAALRLRRWALGVLAAECGAEVAPPPAASPRAWELFLRAERCAFPLHRRLRASGAERALPPDAARKLGAIAIEEMQRVLSARAQLQRLSRWAADRGETAVVLKGGVAAADENEGISLADIDVWVAPDAEAALLEALACSGHVSRSNRTTRHHHAARLADQMVAVEVHTAVPYADLGDGWLGRVRPLHAAFPGLARLDAADHLWHVLVHATVQHLERRGQLRDVLLIAHARSIGSEAQRRDVLERARRSRHAEPLLAMLDMAGRIGSGSAPIDPFARIAASRYLYPLVHRSDAPMTRLRVPGVAAVLDGPRSAVFYVASAWRHRDVPARMPALRALQRRSRRFGGAVVLALRMAKRTLVLLLALRSARAARRLARIHDRRAAEDRCRASAARVAY
ncbi:MAG TPA: nucleotidyltransferase family protein [Longimicrobiales bacterium]